MIIDVIDDMILSFDRFDYKRIIALAVAVVIVSYAFNVFICLPVPLGKHFQNIKSKVIK